MSQIKRVLTCLGVIISLLSVPLFPIIEKKANVIGAILNNRKFVIPGAIYNRV